jgi:O-succinylbenzoic acid--CoA ligase
MKIDNWLTKTAEALPDQVALVAGDEELSYKELEHRAVSAARRLSKLGVGRGDRVALVLEPSGGYVVVLHALIKLGAVAAPLDPGMAEPELEETLARLEPRLLLRDHGEATEASEKSGVALDDQLDTDAVQCVIHTSGSAGRPKPVELTYGNHLWNAIGSGVRIGVAPSDRWLCCLPLHHIGGFAIVMRCALYRTGMVLERFDAERVAGLIGSQPVTLISLVPTMLDRLLDVGAELGTLRCLLLGGGPCPSSTIERALEAGAPVTPTYGLTEAASQVATMSPGEAPRKPGSVGPPILTTEVRTDADGTILVRGPIVAPSVADADGWLRTNDLGRLDEEGYLYMLGRSDQVIVSGGENVSPEEVECVLLDHPAVADAGVAGNEDPAWQHAVMACVVLVEGASVTPDDLRRFCRERLAGYKVPKEIRFMAELPRSSQGKLLREKLAK